MGPDAENPFVTPHPRVNDDDLTFAVLRLRLRTFHDEVNRMSSLLYVRHGHNRPLNGVRALNGFDQDSAQPPACFTQK